jgi:hypothetical protein
MKRQWMTSKVSFQLGGKGSRMLRCSYLRFLGNELPSARQDLILAKRECSAPRGRRIGVNRYKLCFWVFLSSIDQP